MDKNILVIFDDKEGEKLADLSLKGVQTSMTPFQINHFVLNRQEFTTDFARFQQAKFELYKRVQNFYDLYYQYREASAEIDLLNAEIEQTGKSVSKTKEAKTELKRIAVERHKFKIACIKKEASDRLEEALVFLAVYEKHKHFDELSREEMEKHEEEAWRIKSAYYPELRDRYGLTPKGFLKLPHEGGRGLKGLIEHMKEAKLEGNSQDRAGSAEPDQP